MQATQTFSSLDFILQGGIVSIMVATILLVMSVMSWYYIITKAFGGLKIQAAITRDIADFWSKPSLHMAMQQAADTPSHRLAMTAVESTQHYQQYSAKGAAVAISQDEFIARNMRRTLIQEQAALESGLSLLASVGSVAPFVGLFGTVWGIYHALAAISASGQATIDKVAGPVGEALIMTAIGLAVAIPAVLAYNAYIKMNRTTMATLEQFAQDLHTLLITGAPLVSSHAK
ncbi:MAG TPA: MotA/TolQ/ExbB proton channel family protein, partial [Methylophilus sp.]